MQSNDQVGKIIIQEHEVSVYFSRTAFETFINSCRDALNNTQAL